MHLPPWIRCVLEAGLLLLLLVLPLVLNPWAALPFEPIKALTLRFSVMGLWGFLLLSALISGRVRFIAVSESDGSLNDASDAPGSLLAQMDRAVVPLALLYGGIHVVATLISVNPSQSLLGNSDHHGLLTTWGSIGLFLLARIVFTTRRTVDRLLLTLVGGSVPICLYSLVQAVGFDSLAWQTDSISPVLSTLGRSNFLGAYIAMMLPLNWYLWQRFHHFGPMKAGLFLLLFGLLAVSLLLTQARAGALAAVVGLSVMWLCWRWGRAWRPTLAGISILWLLSILCLSTVEILRPFDPSPFAVGSTTMGPSGEVAKVDDFATRRSAAIARRPIIWSNTVALIQKRWFLGYGPETFPDLFNQAYPPGTLYDGADSFVDDPHNLLLAEWMAAGLLGVLTLVALMGCWVFGQIGLLCGLNYQGLKAEGIWLIGALLGTICAYLVQAQFNPDVVAVSALFWLVLGIRSRNFS